jgi:predicted transcriptional regulator
MARFKKTRADAVQEAALGSNIDGYKKEVVEFVAKKMAAIDGIRGEIKDKLNEAKEAGILKQAVRGAVNDLRMTEEQRQATEEVSEARKELTRLCRDLPMFASYDEAEAA